MSSNNVRPVLTQSQAEVLVAMLKSVRSRPQLYVSRTDDIKGIQTFLTALSIFCFYLTGFEYETFNEVGVQRGWTNSGEGMIPSMREAGLSDEAIVTELIDIHIKAYEQIFKLQELGSEVS